MSIVDTSIIKQPLKMIEVPLNKFREEVIPHHQKMFDQHKPYILKLLSQGNVAVVQQEIKNKKKVIKQLKDLMYELDTLRAQVENDDLDRFDTKTLSLRKTILNLLNGYSDLEKRYQSLLRDNAEKTNPSPATTSSPFDGSPQLQLHEPIDEIKLKQHEEILREVESIQRDAEDLNEMYSTLHEMVDTQLQPVDHIEESVESTRNNVDSGLKQLIKAHKFKAASYPLMGAALGSAIGGPIGLVAGLKIGGIASLGCAIAGYTGGRFFKKSQEVENAPVEDEIIRNNSSNDDETNQNQTEAVKKDI